MKDKFTKQEVQEVVQEIIGDYWNKLFHKQGQRDTGQKLIKNKKPEELKFATRIRPWIDQYVDDLGFYMGPNLPPDFYKNSTYIRNVNDDYNLGDIDTINRWNNALYIHSQRTEGYDKGYDKKDLRDAGETLLQNFYRMINDPTFFPT